MRSRKVYAAMVGISLAVGLSACAPNGMPAPVMVEAGEVQGTTVNVTLDGVIVITTGELAVDSYTAKIADPGILEFSQGREGEDGGATFNPGLEPKKVGTTTVKLTNDQADIQPIEFTVTVTKACCNG